MSEPKIISQAQLLAASKELRDRIEISMHKLGPAAKSYHNAFNSVVASLSQLNSQHSPLADEQQVGLFDNKARKRRAVSTKPNRIRKSQKGAVASKPTDRATGNPRHKGQRGSGHSTGRRSARKPNAAFMNPMQPDSILGAVVGERAMPRTEITKKLWDYIKKNGLQDANNRRQINADDKLRAVFGKSKVTMFEMNALILEHLKKAKTE